MTSYVKTGRLTSKNIFMTFLSIKYIDIIPVIIVGDGFIASIMVYL